MNVAGLNKKCDPSRCWRSASSSPRFWSLWLQLLGPKTPRRCICRSRIIGSSRPRRGRRPANRSPSKSSNLDATPAEFESKTLRVEKVVAAGGKITVQIRPLAAGRYRFFDDYHEDTTEGFLNVQ